MAAPKKNSGKKGGEVYKWFTQIRLVFQGKPRTYHSDEDKIAYALSNMTGATQNWAIRVLQALDKGHHNDLLISYNAF